MFSSIDLLLSIKSLTYILSPIINLVLPLTPYFPFVYIGIIGALLSNAIYTKLGLKSNNSVSSFFGNLPSGNINTLFFFSNVLIHSPMKEKS